MEQIMQMSMSKQQEKQDKENIGDQQIKQDEGNEGHVGNGYKDFVGGKGEVEQVGVFNKQKRSNEETSKQVNIGDSQVKMQGFEGKKKMSNGGQKSQMKSKVKKIQLKCQLCKGNGRKVEMKRCFRCGLFSHIHCIQDDENKGRYICEKCRGGNDGTLDRFLNKGGMKLQKKDEKNDLKNGQRKLQKDRKNQESRKVFMKFKERYPYYVSQLGKVKFPIQDKLLQIYREYFEVSDLRVVPDDHPIIPCEYLGDLMAIQNFIVSYGNEFGCDYDGEYRKNSLYVLLDCNGSDRTFQRLMVVLLKIYLKDVYEKNKTQNVKILNDNSFFILLGTVNQEIQVYSRYVARMAPEIIGHLSRVPSMKSSFEGFVFPLRLGIGQKLYVLVHLIQGLSQVDSFHDWVSKKSERISQMTKYKSDLLVRLKRNQVEALSNREMLKEMERKEGGRGVGVKVNKKELQRDRKRRQKMKDENVRNEGSIKDDRLRVLQIGRQIPFVISQVLYLGRDRNGSQYYFYVRECDRVYVRYRGYVMDQGNVFKIFIGRQKVLQFMKTLSMKGLYEKKLYESINNLMKENIFKVFDDGDEEESYVEQPDEQCQYYENQQFYRKDLVDLVFEMEEKFTEYLLGRGYQWGCQGRREQFRVGFGGIEDLRVLIQEIKMLHESFLFVEVVRREGEDDGQDELMEKGLNGVDRQVMRKKKPVRIWGINSQKIRRFWGQYLQGCNGYMGVWMSVSILKNYLEKYIKRKMEMIYEEEKRQIEERERGLKQKMLGRIREERRQRRNVDKGGFKGKGKMKDKDGKRDQKLNGMKIRRSMRNCQLKRSLAIDSQDQQFVKSGTDQEYQESEQCDICKDIGNVICCDSCPKVFHLQCIDLKEIPEGQWSCKECLYRMNNQRQTRSRGRK